MKRHNHKYITVRAMYIQSKAKHSRGIVMHHFSNHGLYCMTFPTVILLHDVVFAYFYGIFNFIGSVALTLNS